MSALTYAQGTIQNTNYVRVGHNSSAYNNDAVWSFKLPKAAKVVVFKLSWDNSAAGTGWSDSFSYTFAVSTNGAAGRTAYSGTHLAKGNKTLSGATGSTSVTFVVNLAANTTYYLRANQAGTTKSTLKCFAKDGNKVNDVEVNGDGVATITVNGNNITTLKRNGTTIF